MESQSPRSAAIAACFLPAQLALFATALEGGGVFEISSNKSWHDGWTFWLLAAGAPALIGAVIGLAAGIKLLIARQGVSIKWQIMIGNLAAIFGSFLSLLQFALFSEAIEKTGTAPNFLDLLFSWLTIGIVVGSLVVFSLLSYAWMSFCTGFFERFGVSFD